MAKLYTVTITVWNDDRNFETMNAFQKFLMDNFQSGENSFTMFQAKEETREEYEDGLRLGITTKY